MKWMTAILVVSMALGTLGCESKPKRKFLGEDEVEFNRAMATSYKIDQVDAAIVRQQTLYAYHFIANSADLTEIGNRDVGVLADHYRFHPGHLNIRRQGASDELYEARCESVMTALIAGGVDEARMELGDGLPGGDGMTSEEGLVIWEQMLEPPASNGGNTSSTQTVEPAMGNTNYQ